MRYIVPQETIDKVVELKRKGVKNADIAKQLDIKYGTVKSIYLRILGSEKPTEKNIQKMRSQVIEDRKIMTIQEVAKKHNRTISTINSITRGLPKNQLFRKPYIKQKRSAKKDHVQDRSEVNKGLAKVRRELRVYPTKKSIKEGTRPVKMHDSKNTIIYVKQSISDEQSRINFAEKEKQRLHVSKFRS